MHFWIYRWKARIKHFALIDNAYERAYSSNRKAHDQTFTHTLFSLFFFFCWFNFFFFIGWLNISCNVAMYIAFTDLGAIIVNVGLVNDKFSLSHSLFGKEKNNIYLWTKHCSFVRCRCMLKSEIHLGRRKTVEKSINNKKCIN